MININDEIGDIQIELSEVDKRITGYKTISFNELIDMVEDLKDELQDLQDEYDDFKQEVEDNYKPISVAEQYDISDKDFI